MWQIIERSLESGAIVTTDAGFDSYENAEAVMAKLEEQNVDLYWYEIREV